MVPTPSAEPEQVQPEGREAVVSVVSDNDLNETEPEHFKPTGTIFILVCFVATLILLWLSVYLILVSRGVTG